MAVPTSNLQQDKKLSQQNRRYNRSLRKRYLPPVPYWCSKHARYHHQILQHQCVCCFQQQFLPRSLVSAFFKAFYSSKFWNFQVPFSAIVLQNWEWEAYHSAIPPYQMYYHRYGLLTFYLAWKQYKTITISASLMLIKQLHTSWRWKIYWWIL